MGQAAPCTSRDGDGGPRTPRELRESNLLSGPTAYMQQLKRPMRILLVRHGQSEGNVKRSITQHVPDPEIHLSELGRQQSHQAGTNIKTLIKDGSSVFYCSPYVRALETLRGIGHVVGTEATSNVHVDPFLREQDFGNFDKPDVKQSHKEKKAYGKFYYRFPEGESPCDVYGRASMFLESLYRRWATKYTETAVIVSHELFLIMFVMRMFRYPFQDYYKFDDLKNCEIIGLERDTDKLMYDITFTWAPGEEKVKTNQLRKKSEANVDPHACVELWDGDLGSPMIESKETWNVQGESSQNGLQSQRTTQF